MKHDVYHSEQSNDYFSSRITRDFGQNKVITLDNGGQLFCSVMPLYIDPVECGMKKIGYVDGEE